MFKRIKKIEEQQALINRAEQVSILITMETACVHSTAKH